MNSYRKSLLKIKLNLEKYALKGRDNYNEYSKYIDDLVSRGDFNSLIEVLYTYYDFDTSNKSVDALKKTAWKEICFQTNSSFLVKLKKLYNQKKVYQNSYDIFSTNLDNINLSLSDPLSYTFSETSLTQSFFLTKEDSGYVNLNLTRDSLYSYKIYKADWIDENGVNIPTKEVEIMDVLVGTSSELKTDITLDSIRQYWISTVEKQGILEGYTYSNSFTSSTATSSITWSLDGTSSGYVLNISTYSNFDSMVANYHSVKYGTVSSGNYLVYGSTASLFINNLESSTDYFYRVRNSGSTYINSVTVTSSSTASLTWPKNPLANSYSLDFSTSISFPTLLFSLTLGTISNTSSYYTTGVSNEYIASGLTQGVYYYKARPLFGNTQSGSFTTSESFGLATWPLLDIATSYLLETSLSSTFSSKNTIKLGTSSDVNYTISGLTASLILNNLKSNKTYYYNNKVLKGENRLLNYKVDMTQTTFLGKIFEREIFTPDAKYLLMNKQFANIVGARKTYLEVYKFESGGFVEPVIFAYDNPEYTEEKNLLTRYSNAIDYLNS